MEILHYIDVVRRKDDLNTDVLLWYYTAYPHPSDHDINCITRIKNIFRKQNKFLWTYVISFDITHHEIYEI